MTIDATPVANAITAELQAKIGRLDALLDSIAARHANFMHACDEVPRIALRPVCCTSTSRGNSDQGHSR